MSKRCVTGSASAGSQDNGNGEKSSLVENGVRSHSRPHACLHIPDPSRKWLLNLCLCHQLISDKCLRAASRCSTPTSA